MTDPPTDDDDGVLYEPESVRLIDGELYIPDIIEFADALDALAWQWSKGELFVLERSTSKWINVEWVKPPIKSVQ